MKMKSNRTKVLILAVIAIIWLVVGTYGITRPIAYGVNYYHATMYEGDDFNGTMIFHPDGTMIVRNTNFNEDLALRYYYKDGYIFFPMPDTDAEYTSEVAAINADFEGAVNSPFYASKINAFQLSSEGLDGYQSVYLCQISIMMVVFWGIIELVLIGIAIASVVRCKKMKCGEL